jgi:hypothetical protein
MNNRIGRQMCLTATALLFLVPFAFGNSTVTMSISDPPSNNVRDNIYVGGYSATVQNGGDPKVVCDDFADETGYGSQTYKVNSFSNLGATLWGSYLMGKGDTLSQVTAFYDQAAWLTLGMFGQTNKQLQGDYSYAIWAVFDPKAVAAWLILHGDLSAYNAVFGSGGLLWKAQNQLYAANEFANFLILTPQGCTVGKCGQQEFFEVVPEGGPAVAYLLLAGLSCFGAMLFRRRLSTVN